MQLRAHPPYRITNTSRCLFCLAALVASMFTCHGTQVARGQQLTILSMDVDPGTEGTRFDPTDISADGSRISGAVLGNPLGQGPYFWTVENQFQSASSITRDAIWPSYPDYCPDCPPVPFVPGHLGPYPRDMSGDGLTLVGSLSAGVNLADQEGYRWRKDLGFNFIGGLPGSFDSTAEAVNYDGTVIVGESWSEFGFRPYRWSEAVGFEDLGSLGGRGASTSVSDDGDVVVGFSEIRPLNADVPFRWTRETGIVALSELAQVAADDPLFSNSRGIKVSPDGSTIFGSRFRWNEVDGLDLIDDVVTSPFTNNPLMMNIKSSNGDGTLLVGNSGNFFDPEFLGLLWDPVNGTQVFQDWLSNNYGMGDQLAGLEIATIDDISADGRAFIGELTLADGTTEGYLITVPEPSGVVLRVWLFAMVSCLRRWSPFAPRHFRAT